MIKVTTISSSTKLKPFFLFFSIFIIDTDSVTELQLSENFFMIERMMFASFSFFTTLTDQQNEDSFVAQRGQVGVIVLLIMVGMLAMGLSLAVRTTQESFLSGKESDTARVFNAAEQGVETALSGNLAEGDFEFDQGQVHVDYTVRELDRLETRMFEGIPIGISVVGATSGNELRLDWSKVDDCGAEDPASMMVGVYNNDGPSTQVRYLALEGCDRSDDFNAVSHINLNGYYRRYDLALQDGDFLVRVKPVYNDTWVKIEGVSGFTLPKQFYSIRSEASEDEGNETRVVEVNAAPLTAPSILDYALYSGNTLIK